MSDPKNPNPVPPPPEDYDYFDADNADEDPEEALMDECMLRPDGQCGLAGSEHCDFVCPMRDSEFFAGSEAWKKKRAGKP